METTKTFTEQEWRELKIKARREMSWCDIKEYSHNLIGLYMANMSEPDMLKFATELQLDKLGWEHLLDASITISEEDLKNNNLAFALRNKRRINELKKKKLNRL